ncbi:MAG: hypothetical protein Q7R49_03615 [Candidatus Daviesbacteria bacterium]|nr:hypothetical protein [Candidatus Daviesbacteria bacterium]
MFKFFSLFLIALIFLVPKDCFAHSQVQIIEMTTNGFVPQEAIIDESSTVIFINQDTIAHWPASDIHPTHEIYQEFDPKKGIEPNQSWTFKFTKVGEWNLHDHLSPHFRGKITVINEPGNAKIVSSGPNLWDMIKNFFKQITDKFKVKRSVDLSNLSNLSQEAQIRAVKEMSEQEGVEKVWKKIKEEFKGQSGTTGNIHDLAHLTGNLLYIQKGFEGLNLCSADFAFGCYHGFLDEAFRKNLDNLLDAQKACLKLGQAGSGPVASCIHGIGHGIASFYSTTDVKKALSSCRKLTSGAEYCFDGVFMEFARNAPDSYIKKDDPLYPCDSLEKEFGYAYSSACGRNQPSLMRSRLNMSFEQVIPACLGSDSTPFQESCIESLGFSLASSGDSEKIIQGCQMMGAGEYIKRCVKAAAGELVFQDVPGWEQKSQVVCESFQDNLDECLSYINKLAVDYHRVKK